MVLGQMIAVEPGGFRRLQQGEPVLECLLRRLAAIVDVIEDTKLHAERFQPATFATHSRASENPESLALFSGSPLFAGTSD